MTAAEARAPAGPRWVAALKLVLTLSVALRYGYFRDELYYLACARRLAWGYVDHPPLSVAILAGVRGVLGESLFVLRIVPALMGTALVLLTARMARRMGAGPGGQTFAALCVLCTPTYLGTHHVYSMNSIDGVIWAAASGLFACILHGNVTERATRRHWLALGVVLGLGLLNKASVLWLVGGAFLGLLSSPARAQLRTRWPWLAVAIAAALVTPHVVWQVANGWPVREFVHNATTNKMVDVSVGAFFGGQLVSLGPAVAAVAACGLVALFVRKDLRTLRPLGVAFVAVLFVLLANGKSRADYLAAAYPPLIAAGGFALEKVARGRRWPFALSGALAGGMALLVLPFALPVLSVDAFVRYQSALGLTPRTEEKKELGPLPQHYADMFGWPEMTDAVASAAATLSPQDRETAVVITGNYGEAGAFELFGGGRLPPIVSGHNNYWLWGPARPDAQVVLRLLEDEPDVPEYLSKLYASCTKAARFESRWVMPYENHLTVYICRNPRERLGDRWPRMKHYD